MKNRPQLHVRGILPPPAYERAVETTVDALFVDGAYAPFLKRYVLCAAIFENFTDYDGDFGPDAIFSLCEDRAFFAAVCEKIDAGQLRRFFRDVDAEIARRRTRERPPAAG